MQDLLIPEIDENIPLPANAAEALPDLTPEAEIEMRARSIKLIADMTGTPLCPDENDISAAREIATAHHLRLDVDRALLGPDRRARGHLHPP